jgi:hypothetical protein
MKDDATDPLDTPAAAHRWRAAGVLIRILTCVLLVSACINSAPSSESDALANLPGTPYSAGTGFGVDATRMLDLLRIEAGLLKYKGAHGSYPPSLDDLLPADAPIGPGGQPLTAIPHDPATHQPYAYAALSGGSGYRLGAILSNGRTFTGFSHSAARR